MTVFVGYTHTQGRVWGVGVQVHRLTWVQSSSVRCGRMYLSDSDSRYTCQKLALLLLLRRQCRIAGIRFD